MKTWIPSYVNMVSRDDSATILRRHADHLRFYNATDADCSITNIEPTKPWDKVFPDGTEYRLLINSYLGWKVYMLHTGCYASKPEYETV